MCRISKIITFLESLHQAGWFDSFESDIQALLIFDPLITLWGNFDAPYLKLLNDASVASACFYVRTCRRVRNSKKLATIRNFHLPGSFLCLSTRLIKRSVNPEIVKNIASCNVLIITGMYIKVYISGMEMSQRIRFWCPVLPKIVIFWENGKKITFLVKNFWTS